MPASNAVFRQWNFKVQAVALVSNQRGDCMALSLGDGSFRLLEAHADVEQPEEIAGHEGVSLCLVPDADDHAFLSGGDDGQVLVIEKGQSTSNQLAIHQGKWVDIVAGSVGGQRAYSVGKNVYMVDAAGNQIGAPLSLPSSCGGMAFSPNGKRLAASHYNGVTIWWANAKQPEPSAFQWKGSHLGLCWHPDGKIILSAMQEAALHGWRLPDNKEMQMQGYTNKVGSMAFTARGKYLATSGAEQVICWPFFGGGPWGKAPLVLGGMEPRTVCQVAPHGKDELVAAGYTDGMIMLAPLDGRMELVIHPPMAGPGEPGYAVVGLCWNAAGDCLFAAHENGIVSLFTLESVGQFARRAT